MDGILFSNLELPPMLHIGKRSFIPVPAQCGIYLQLDPIGPAHSRQVWRIDAAFVSADEDQGTAPWCGNKFWRQIAALIPRFHRKDPLALNAEWG
jgi:hypothetical protein